MATTIHTRIYARGEVSFAEFLFLLSWFVKLLETNFSYFAKIRWMSSWFAKLFNYSIVQVGIKKAHPASKFKHNINNMQHNKSKKLTENSHKSFSPHVHGAASMQAAGWPSTWGVCLQFCTRNCCVCLLFFFYFFCTNLISKSALSIFPLTTNLSYKSAEDLPKFRIQLHPPQSYL
jgi:hypothetical protein